MLALLVYRVWFARGGDRRLFVLLMCVYYSACMLFVYASLTDQHTDTGLPGMSDPVGRWSDIFGRMDAAPSGTLDSLMNGPASATTFKTTPRPMTIEERWFVRRRQLQRFCDTHNAISTTQSQQRSLILAPRRRLSSCLNADTPGRLLLSSSLSLAPAPAVVPTGSPRVDHQSLTSEQLLRSCVEQAESKGLLVKHNSAAVSRVSLLTWSHVLVVMEPALRLALGYLASDSWPCRQSFSYHSSVLPANPVNPGCNFSTAVDSLLTTVIGSPVAQSGFPERSELNWHAAPEWAWPIVSSCDVCRRVHSTYILHLSASPLPDHLDHRALHSERLEFEDELEAIASRLSLPLLLSLDKPRPYLHCAASEPLLEQARVLIGQLSEEQLRQIRHVYDDDLRAFSRGSHSRLAPHIDLDV